MKKFILIFTYIFMSVFLLTACTNDTEEGNITATLVIDCSTVLDNFDMLSEEKKNIIPDDGTIFKQEIKFNEGDSVFDILQKETKNNKIHMEFEEMSGFNTYYIKGIGNLYSMDCGDSSGWFFGVNDEFPSVGSESYYPEEGDTIQFLYSCDFGLDLGIEYE